MDIDKKFKLLTAEVKFLKKELELVEDIIKEAQPAFNKEVLERLSLDGEIESNSNCEVASPEEKKKNSKSLPVVEDNLRKDAPTDQKKLFKKIALRTHPDKLSDKSEFEKKFKANLFEKAHKAINEDDYHSLVEIAESLNLDIPPPSKEHIQNLKKNQAKLKKRITTFKGSFLWAWYFEEDREKKDRIVDRYVEHVRRNNSQ